MKFGYVRFENKGIAEVRAKAEKGAFRLTVVANDADLAEEGIFRVFQSKELHTLINESAFRDALSGKDITHHKKVREEFADILASSEANQKRVDEEAAKKAAEESADNESPEQGTDG